MASHEPLPGKCGSRLTNGSGLFCTNSAGARTDHKGHGRCYLHGGASPNGRKHGARERARGEFGRLLDECGVATAGRTVPEAISDGLDRCGAMVLAWASIVEELEQDSSWTWVEHKGARGGVDRWVTTEVLGVLGPNSQGELTVHTAVREYGRWVELYVRVAKIAADLGIEERKVRLAEQQGELINRILEGVLDELGVDRQKAGPVVARHLRAVS